MKSIYRILIILFYFTSLYSYGQNKVIWEIGSADNSSLGMALAPSDYKRFLENDFGWEDRFYLAGFSLPQQDWPYVLPGPKDSWGGTGPTSGIRSHVLNILFGLENLPVQGKWKFVVDILGNNVDHPPYLRL